MCNMSHKQRSIYFHLRILLILSTEPLPAIRNMVLDIKCHVTTMFSVSYQVLLFAEKLEYCCGELVQVC